MTKKQWYINLAVVMLFSTVGGFLAEMAFNIHAGTAKGYASQIINYTVDGQPAQAFYGEDGQMRIQLGTYNAPGERGLPLIGLSDNNGHLRFLFRLAGANQSPVLIMKDQNGQDRLVMGLAMSDKSEAPFLSIVDANGKTVEPFGHFSGHP